MHFFHVEKCGFGYDVKVCVCVCVAEALERVFETHFFGVEKCVSDMFFFCQVSEESKQVHPRPIFHLFFTHTQWRRERLEGGGRVVWGEKSGGGGGGGVGGGGGGVATEQAWPRVEVGVVVVELPVVAPRAPARLRGS